MLAPDPEAAPVSENDECKSSVWQFLAPDDNFTDPKAPPMGIFPPNLSGRSSSSNSNFPGTPQTPETTQTSNKTPNGSDLEKRVLSACRDTSRFMRSPMPERKINDKFLRCCASTKALNKKLLKKMRVMIEEDSFHGAYLMRARATRMGESAPDGYTSLMVAAYANHIEAATLILELANDYATSTGDTTSYKDLHLDTDMFGSNALHIASEQGHMDMVQFLLPLYKFSSPPPRASSKKNTAADSSKNIPLVDLGGRTAFGRAVTSPVPKAKRNQRSLEKQLFSNNDLSIFGKVKPMGERMGSIQGLGLEYGTSDMPGMRGYMEDAMSVETWVQEGTNSIASGELALFAVCDGHGDNGKISDFCAKNAKSVLNACICEYEQENRDQKNLVIPSHEYWSAVWQSTCLKLDHKLREARLAEGGSTGVFALVTNQEIVVANVGDSRCILASSKAIDSLKQAEKDPVDDSKNHDADTNDGKNESSNDKVSNEGSNKGNNEGNNEGSNEGSNENGEESAVETTQTTTETETESSDAPPALVVEEESSSVNKKESKVVVTALSEDHKPNLPDEIARVRMAGFDVESTTVKEEDGTETFIHKVVKGAKEKLAVSRAFGDFDYKANKQLSELEQAVIPLADVIVHTRKPNNDLYLVLACDGIWDVMENDDVIDVIERQVKIKSEISPESLLPDVADVLLQECLGKDSRDNMSAIVVSLQPNRIIEKKNDAEDAFTPKTLDFGSPN